MDELRFFLENLWRRTVGMEEIQTCQIDYDSITKNIKKCWFPVVERRFRKLVFGGLRYGMIGDLQKPTYDRIADAQYRIEQYGKTGNLEYLYDAGNLLDLEILESKHPRLHWREIDDGPHSGVVR